MVEKSILIVGAGPVGSLLAIYMAKRGYAVSVYDKREDPRKTLLDDGRSINLALSHRGIHALTKAGIEKNILVDAIPMNGRMVHTIEGQTNFQPYGEEGQFINSISRGGLNRALIEIADQQFGIQFYFNEKCLNVDFERNTITFENYQTHIRSEVSYSLLAGSDGAFSQVRLAMNAMSGFETKMDKLTHGYKELTIATGKNQTHLIEKNALHIWPRGDFMLIALPNIDGSFTCTLFLPFTGKNSFESIKDQKELNAFFHKNFPDALSLISSVEEEYFAIEPSFLSTIQTYPWVYKNVFLIGDAAHAMVPFYGQGMNAGFEDVRILDEMLSLYHDDWNVVLSQYQKSRKPNADAISALAMKNFVEMRDLVDDENFILRKKIEAAIHAQFKQYLPQYSMVTFSDIPYADAYKLAQEHDLLMEEILALPSIESRWKGKEGWSEIEKLVLKTL